MNLFKKNCDFNEDYKVGFYSGIDSQLKMFKLFIASMRKRQKKYPNVYNDKSIIEFLLNYIKTYK